VKAFIVNDYYADYSASVRRKKKRKSTVPAWLSLVCFLALCFAVAGLGAHFSSPEIRTWYASLVKPRFNPPNWVFAPVWTALYAIMAVAAWLVWRHAHRSQRIDGMVLFAIQLILNFAWTYIFFHLHRLLVSTVVILALWLAIVGMIALFWRVRTIAGAILLPYLAWVTFAIALNLVLLRHN
jgi:benzodiazapine receptor